MSITIILIIAVLAIVAGVGIGIWLQRPVKQPKPLPSVAPVGTVLVSNTTNKEFTIEKPPILKPGVIPKVTVRYKAISVAWPAHTVDDHFKTK